MIVSRQCLGLETLFSLSNLGLKGYSLGRDSHCLGLGLVLTALI